MAEGALNGWLKPGLIVTLVTLAFGAGAWVAGVDVKSALSGDIERKLGLHIASGGHPDMALQIAVMDERQQVLQRDVADIREMVEQIRDSLHERQP